MDAASSIAKLIEPGNLVILESTSPVGTTEKIGELIENKSGISKDLFSIAYCPERVLPGRALIEIVSNNRVIGGIDENSQKKVEISMNHFVKALLLQLTQKLLNWLN